MPDCLKCKSGILVSALDETKKGADRYILKCDSCGHVVETLEEYSELAKK
jgi:transcription elongation factor Elf1